MLIFDSKIENEIMKTRKQLLFLLMLAFCPLFLFGQLKHEVKIVPLDLFSTFTPSYEIILNEKIGVEIEVSFSSRDITLFSSLSGNSFPTEAFDRKLFIPGISGKYFFSSEKYGSGFYIGPHLRLTFTTFIEDTFEAAYFMRFNDVLPFWGRKGFQNFNAGLNTGYKWLFIKEHLIVEPSLLFTSFYSKGENGIPGGRGFDFDIAIRVGYRF